MTALTQDQILTHLHALPQWSVVDHQLVRVFKFSTFPEAIRFVDQVAILAESASHHPDIDIRYTSITLRLSTHDVNGLTATDFTLATKIDQV